MKFVKTIIILIFLFHLSSFNLVNAIYDPLSVPNNKYGIHILETGELPKAAELVNSGGGEWGYVTIPIRANERDVLKWTAFMETAKNLKLIPILRIATYPVGDHWMAPNEWDLIDFSNFLNDLAWPTKNRYVTIYNEPNHQGEWGGFVYPEEYARVLDRGIDIFHKKHPDFFVISAGMDASAPNDATSMDSLTYLRRMEDYIPGIFKKVDGFSVHAYGNPAFSTAPNPRSPVNIKSYLYEENLLTNLEVAEPKLFITEAGWKKPNQHYLDAFQNYWLEENIVAITPFVLGAHAGPFKEFSFTSPSGEFEPFAKEIQRIPKIAGNPQQSNRPPTSRDTKLTVNLTQKIGRSYLEINAIVEKLLSFLKL